ncbi:MULTISPECIES: ribose-5-phosphate isomerase RpiA [unclassified Paenibacillus]|uniref:ribose-5-phosphate isomerase RpiA n=1 Tax=unclassified Paenibacillus TaxID=185978 RepID=UPI001C10543A|nr:MULTISPECIES: ribose-5-phosphate isomerase RpiA [unclassified Paenibacillus]MBU5442399.1 ribose-5-phosphate isomerase RpiA [Paenibacillus sp. MSJ-34]CAH0119435.1 Ribose-5-phosphate isomerase A [Paenibacillus sp. CECT 9249]
MDAKQRVAEAAVEQIEDGMKIGLGTGSTAYWAIRKIAEKVKEGLRIKAIATSKQSEALAREFGIPLSGFSQIDDLDIAIDGADEVDSDLNLIKGGGGALLREKIVAAASRRFIVIADESKIVKTLGRFPLPVEIVPFGMEATLRNVQQLGCTPVLRRQDGGPYITDNGNYIADCDFGTIEDPAALHRQLNGIPGVVDNGLFVGMARQVYVGYKDGTIERLDK